MSDRRRIFFTAVFDGMRMGVYHARTAATASAYSGGLRLTVNGGNKVGSMWHTWAPRRSRSKCKTA